MPKIMRPAWLTKAGKIMYLAKGQTHSDKMPYDMAKRYGWIMLGSSSQDIPLIVGNKDDIELNRDNITDYFLAQGIDMDENIIISYVKEGERGIDLWKGTFAEWLEEMPRPFRQDMAVSLLRRPCNCKVRRYGRRKK